MLGIRAAAALIRLISGVDGGICYDIVFYLPAAFYACYRIIRPTFLTLKVQVAGQAMTA